MSCLTVRVERIGGMSATVQRIGGISIAVGLVCTTSLAEEGIIWASDGKLITLEGGYLIAAE